MPVNIQQDRLWVYKGSSQQGLIGAFSSIRTGLEQQGEWTSTRGTSKCAEGIVNGAHVREVIGCGWIDRVEI
jgi:hypothetical protein